MGYYDNTPINNLLRKREINTSRCRICYEGYREAIATVGRAVPAQDVWWNGNKGSGAHVFHNGSGWGTTWQNRIPDRWQYVPESPAGMWEPGWVDMTSGNVTTTTTTSSTHGSTGGVMLPVNINTSTSTSTMAERTGGATSVNGRTRGIEEFLDAQDEGKEGSKRSKAESK